jgi:disulfide bond formation protein DsbB
MLRKLSNFETRILLIVAFSSCIALGGAYFSEYLGYKPCILCLYQRIPYFFLLIISLIAIFTPKYFKNYITLIMITLVCEISIALYHVAIEHKLIAQTSQCLNSSVTSDNAEEALKQMQSTEFVSCANPTLVIFNLSMAEWNVIFCLAIMILIHKLKKRNVTR